VFFAHHKLRAAPNPRALKLYCAILKNMNTSTIGAGKANSQMRAWIAESVSEVLADPDFGLDLTTEMKRALRTSQKASRRTYVSLATLRKRLG
ncbi:MAG: hypothetical protein AAB920_03335, partial [Patescibacteria group bacterium]